MILQGPKAPPKPKVPLSNPFNINLPGSGLASNNGSGGAIPLVNAPAPVQAAPVAPPAPPPPPPPDFNALTLADPQYIAAQQDRQRQNALALQALQQGFAQTGQSYQDNANRHGALFSGAAVHAQNYNAQNYANQQAQQAANNLQGQHGDFSAAWQRILNQFAGGA